MKPISRLWSLLIAAFLAIPAPGQPALIERAQAMVKAGNAKDAIPILLDLYRDRPRDANLCQQIGIAYTQLEDLANAERFYREAVRLEPGFWAARKNLATVLWFLDRKDESQHEFLAVTTALPTDPVPHLYLGLAAFGQRRYPAARVHFDKAGALALDNPETLPAVVETYLQTRDRSVPSRVVHHMVEAQNPDLDLLSRIGELLLQHGDYDLAALTLERLTSARLESAEAWRMLAAAYAGQNKPEPAYRAYSRAVEAAPNAAEPYVELAEFASSHGNNDYAGQVVEQGLRQLPRSPELLFEKGILLALKGDRSGAEASFKEASRAKPAWNLPWMALGVTQLESGDAKQAIATLKKARDADPSDPRGHYLYATALSKEAGPDAGKGRSEAMGALRKATELDPNDSRSYALLGQLQLAAGETAGAEAELRTALKIEPENTTALYQLGLLLRKQGKAEEAHRVLDKFEKVKAQKHAEEESLVQILKVVPGTRTP